MKSVLEKERTKWAGTLAITVLNNNKENNTEALKVSLRDKNDWSYFAHWDHPWINNSNI